MATFKASKGNIEENISVDISTDNYQLLTSGVVFSPAGESVSIQIDDITVKFIFIERENQKVTVNNKVVSEKVLHIELVNFDNSLGQGKVNPLNFMYTDNFNIYLSYFVHTFSQKEKHRQIAYSIYYGEKE